MLENIPQKVYDLALEKDLPALRALEASGVCLTQLHFEFHLEFNATAKLAFDAHCEAAEFMVDHLMGNVDDLVIGYSKSGNVERANYWVSRGGNRNTAIIGLSYAGCDEAVNSHLHKSRSKHLGEAKFCAIIGYAEQGNGHKVNQLLSEVGHLGAQGAVVGYAKGKHADLGLALATQIGFIAGYYKALPYDVSLAVIPEKYYEDRLTQSARLGDEEVVNRALRRQPIDSYLYPYLARFYAAGGHLFSAEALKAVVVSQRPNLANKFNLSPIDVLPYHFKLAAELLPKTDDHYNYGQLFPNPSPYLSSLYMTMAKQLSKKPEIQTRQLLMMKDLTKSKRLNWILTGDIYLFIATPNINWQIIQKLDKVMANLSLGFDDSNILFSRINYIADTINLIYISLHQGASIFNNLHFLKNILGYVLNSSNEKLITTLHNNISGLFAKHIKSRNISLVLPPLALAKKG